VMSLLALIALTPRRSTSWDAEFPLLERLARSDRTGHERSVRSSAVRDAGGGRGLQPLEEGP
jgi:hypothetical protein